jgi:hypothetical protein
MRSFLIYTFRQMLLEYTVEDEIGRSYNTQEIKEELIQNFDPKHWREDKLWKTHY